MDWKWPKPLLDQLVQFVGFMGAYRNPGDLDPMMAGVAASVITTWVTFVPCFLWIFGLMYHLLFKSAGFR